MSKGNVPQGFHTLTPQLVVKNARSTIKFLETALDAETTHVMPGPGGKGVMHAAVRIGDSTLFLSEAGGFSAKTTTSNTFVYVKNVDDAFARVQKAGAKVLAPLADMFWGDRWAMVEDADGNQWQLATHVEDVPPEEMQKRMANLPQK